MLQVTRQHAAAVAAVALAACPPRQCCACLLGAPSKCREEPPWTSRTSTTGTIFRSAARVHLPIAAATTASCAHSWRTSCLCYRVCLPEQRVEERVVPAVRGS